MSDATATADLVPPPETSHQDIQTSDEEETLQCSTIWGRIRDHAESALAEVELNAHYLFDRPLTDDEVDAASRAANDLAVLFGQLELPNLAQLARQLNKTLDACAEQAHRHGDATTAVHIAGTTDDLRTLLASAIAQQESLEARTDPVVVLGPPSPALDAACWIIQTRGHLVVHHADTLPKCPSAPCAIVIAVEGDLTDADETLLKAVSEEWSAPVVMLFDSDDAATSRTLASYCNTMLPLGTPPDIVATELKRAIITEQVQLTAFICGEAPDAAAKLATHGFDITKVHGPDELQRTLTSQQCAVVFAPNVAATVVFALSRLIRATPALRRTPIIWQSAHDRAQWLQATRLDVFAVDEVDDALTSRLRSLLAKAAADSADQDATRTQVLSWEAARVLLDRTLVAAHRSGTNVAVATLRANESVTPEQLLRVKEVLANEFRRGDIIGMRNDDDLVIALDKVSRSVATNRMKALMDRLDIGKEVARVGVSMFPTDGRSGGELAMAADRAADLAVAHDGPLVANTTWRPEEQLAPDAMVVDADPVLGRVLTSALVDAGLRSVYEEDAREALAKLTNGDSGSIPKLLLLDLDAPGIDGLSMLRQLRASGVMAQLNVLLMTVRSSESDLKIALELGISDVIRKPFSATLLLHRVHMLLDQDR